MKKMLCFILSVLLISLPLFGCGGEEDNTVHTNNITYYTIKDTYSLGSDWVYDYNKSCENDGDKIEIVEFESKDALKSKLTTELMAGGGPDLMDEFTIDSAGLSIEKLIETDAFYNLDELINEDESNEKIDLTKLNPKALESGISNGKRFCIPLYYIPKFLLTTEEKFSKYINSNEKALSYNDILSLSDKLLNDETGMSLYPYDTLSNFEGLLLDYIDDNVDLINKTMSFDDSQFEKNISKIDKLIKQYGNDKSGDNTAIDLTEEIAPDSYIFENMSILTPYVIYSNIVLIEQRGETPKLIGTPSSDTETMSAQITASIFVNRNTTKQRKVLKALKYAISEETQNKTVGAEIEEYNPMFQSSTGCFFPTNNKSFEMLMKTANSFSYNTKDSYYQGDSDGVPDTDVQQASVSDKSKEMFNTFLESITNYKLDTYLYYNGSIINELVSGLVEGEITVDKFISELKSKTKIYLEE